MLIYRAMCASEFEATMKYGVPSFKRKVKWFSPSLEFIISRVKDGRFNNSKFKPERYSHIVEFEVDSLDRADWARGNEIQFNVRRNPVIRVVRIIQ